MTPMARNGPRTVVAVSGQAGGAHPPAGSPRACDRCLSRSWLLSRLAPHLEHSRGRIHVVLGLEDDALIAAVAGSDGDAVRREHETLDVEVLRDRMNEPGVEAICGCDPRYPAQLRDLSAPPATLFVAGGLERLLALAGGEAVAIVGARRASAYGVEVARSLGRSLVRSGVPVISGMALGIDSAAHTGALAADEEGGAERQAPTVAVLPASPASPYPSSKRALHRRIVTTGAAVSELPPGTDVWRWMFPARNRIIAGLAAMTVVVEAGARSGSLLTAALAGELRRPVGAVPGRVTALQARGANDLLARGASVIRDAQDVLDVLYGAGVRAAASERRAVLDPAASSLLGALADGHETGVAFERAGLDAQAGVAALAELELGGHVRRGPGGRYLVIP